jgi:hypothetical protein
MPPRPAEGRTQQEVLHLLKYAIDTAIKYPRQTTVESARKMALDHPLALRSSHLRHNLGDRRWRWLNDHGIDPAGGTTNIADMPAVNPVIR